jgi:hypothetical protein
VNLHKRQVTKATTKDTADRMYGFESEVCHAVLRHDNVSTNILNCRHEGNEDLEMCKRSKNLMPEIYAHFALSTWGLKYWCL